MKSTNIKQPDMRERIKLLAAKLLIKHGCRGVSFGDIADRLSTTRANIHYHFGNKNSLVEEVTDEYVTATLAKFRSIWTDTETPLALKLDATIAFNRLRYDEFNVGDDDGLSWSLVARMRADSDALSPRSVASVQRFASELTSAITVGISSAVGRGELSSSTPIEDVVALLVNIINSAGLVTQDAARFDQLELIYRAFLRTVVAAYGHQDLRAAPGPAKRKLAAVPTQATAGTPSATVARRRRKQL
ncbi:TetR/AcrR family transcriptional regulator [Castellaniella sp.]|uniref:TetR/AcrR family transcriptional regulator n=1 Tax=Castellaniella sp. TaxID=1955812 RepID=UPI0025BB5812|nr:TetR/AcrR family transcriptional regulator [Castellaniella sp.]